MPDATPVRILIVDDETAQMKALCHTLSDQGYIATGFSSAKAALASVKSRQFELVLTDLMMPEMDGIALLRAVLEIDPHLVGVIMTGEGTIATAVEAMKSGAFDYILKPFKLSVVLPVLSRALAMRRLRIANVELEARVHKRTAELEAANRELEAFSYSVSHDLRAPLRHINNYAYALNTDATLTLSDDARRNLAAITRSAERMNTLIEALLNFSRTGRAAMRPAPVNMANLVNEVLQEMTEDVKGRNIEWDIHPLPAVSADRVLLKEVWANLLSNAVKYTRPRNPAWITVICTEKSGEWEFCVRDNGVGFDMAYVDKLFGVFQRLHPEKEFEGTGVGLANVRRSIQRHGGRVWAEGRVDEGTSLYFTLPFDSPT